MTPLRASIATVAVAAFWAIGVLAATLLPMTDPDTWWHIRAGGEILATGSVPRVDTWSIAGAGREWISQDWMSNVLLAVVHGAGEWGPTLVSLLYSLMALAAIWLIWDAIRVRHPSVGWLARTCWLLFGLVLAAPVLGARVQVVDLFLGAATLNVLWRYLASPSLRLLLLLPLIAVAWVNLHAGFPLLFLLGGAAVVGEALDRYHGRSPEGGPLRWQALGWLSVAFAVSAAVLALNPNGIAIYAYPFDTLRISALESFVGEWQPARLDAPAGQLLALFVLVAVLPTLLIAPRRVRTADGLILLGITFMAVTAVRFLLVAGPLGAAVACVVLAPAISDSPFGRRTGRMIARATARPPGVRGAVNAALALVIVAAGVAISVARVLPAAQERAISADYPVAAIAWLDAHEPGERIFNRYEWGGYLGLHLPDRPLFIDGRADVYGDAIIREYVEVTSVNEDPQQFLEDHGIDHILYPGDSTLGRWLNESPDWAVAYEDEVASVWVER